MLGFNGKDKCPVSNTPYVGVKCSKPEGEDCPGTIDCPYLLYNSNFPPGLKKSVSMSTRENIFNIYSDAIDRVSDFFGGRR